MEYTYIYLVVFVVGLLVGYLEARFDNYQPIPIVIGVLVGIAYLYKIISILPVAMVVPVLFWGTIAASAGIALTYSITTKPQR